MSKLKFDFNKEYDLHNLWKLCNIEPLWENDTKPVRQKFIDKWKGRDFEDCKNEIESHLQILYNSEFIKIFSESVNKGWNGINNSFFERLEEVTNKPIYTDEFTANITTSGRCYSIKENNSFLLSIRRPYLHALRTCGHELMHLQFEHYYWKDISKIIGERNTALLSESLTILLNIEFRDLWIAEDVGYDEHFEFREIIGNIWKETHDFDTVVKKGVEHILTSIRQPE